MDVAATQGEDRLARNKRIVLSYFEDIRSIGLPAAHERHLHSDVRWCSVDGELDREGMIHMGIEIHKHVVGTFNLVAGTLTAEDDRVAAEAESDIRLDNGTHYRNRYHFLFQLADNKIVRVHEHYDSGHANEIWKPYAADMMAKADSWNRAPA